MGNNLKTNGKVNNTYTKEMLMRDIASKCRRDINTVRRIYSALEENIAELLSSASSEVDVSIRLFEGITLDSTYVPEKVKLNNLTGETITAMSKIKPKANITRNYREKLTANNK